MTKLELAGLLYERVGGMSKREAFELVEMVLALVKESLGRGEGVLVSSFGRFVLQDKAERVGRNPQTGESLMLASHRTVRFRPSRKLRERINGAGEG